MLDSAPPNLDEVLVNQFTRFDKIVLGLYAVFFSVALFLVSWDAFWLKSFQSQTKGLKIIATVQGSSGSVQRRTVSDLLWISLDKINSIFDGDKIITGSQSTLEIKLSTKMNAILNENSKLSLFMNSDGVLQYRLSEGEILLNSFEEQTLAIQRGAQSDFFKVQKGSYSLKVDPIFGAQLGPATRNPELRRKVQLTKSEPQKEAPLTPSAETNSAPIKKRVADADDTTTPNPESKVTKFKFALPLPQPDTVFLGLPKEQVIIAAQRTCSDSCSLKVFKNNQLWKSADYKIAQETVIRIDPSDLGVGTYDWIFTSETKEFRSRFVVKMFSAEELSRAIDSELPVEIH